MTAVKSVDSTATGSGMSRFSDAPTAAMSAPMLRVLANATRATTAKSTRRGNRSAVTRARPLPVTFPMRAAASCTEIISGRQMLRVHNWP